MRTDQHWLCPTCHARFGGTGQCPGCATTTALDLRTASGRERARVLLPGDGLLRFYALWGAFDKIGDLMRQTLVPSLLAGAGLGVLLSLLLFRDEGVVLFLGGCSGAAIGYLVWAGANAALHLREEFPPEPLRLLAAPVDTAPGITRLRGVARCGEGAPQLAAPLSGTTCIAFRVRGMASAAVIDDAAMVAFELEHDGARVRVLAGPACVDIACPKPRPVGASPALLRFLSSRGAALRSSRARDALPSDEVRLSEATIRDGDVVEVLGAIEAEPCAIDYRHSETRQLLVGTPERPLTICRAA